MLKLWSPAWCEGETIPEMHTRQGANLSPPLGWSGQPAETAALALICFDLDADWYHWLLWNIPSTWESLPQRQPRIRSYQDLAQGSTSYRSLGYDGPAPPLGAQHRYVFRLYALDRPLKLAAGVPGPVLERSLAGKVLARAELMGRFSR